MDMPAAAVWWMQVPAEAQPLHESLPAAEWARARNIRHPENRQAFLWGRLLLRHCLAGNTGQTAQIPLHIDAAGKPHSPDPALPGFNLSHTRNWVAVATAPRGPVGIDLEWRQRQVPQEKLARRFFHAREQQEMQQEDFFTVWTRKEAWLKAEGGGLRGEWSLRNSYAATGWVFSAFRPLPELQLCVCARTVAATPQQVLAHQICPQS